MQEDIEHRLVRGLGDLHMRRPVAELLVGGDGLGQDGEIDILEVGRLGLGDFGGRRGDEPGARLAVGAREAPRVAFAALVERGMVSPGAILTDSKRRAKAIV